MNDELTPIIKREELDLKEIFLVLWKDKLKILFITFLAAIFSVVYALSLPNIYSSSAILSPTSEKDQLSNLAGSLSGFASLSGLTMGNLSGNNNAEAAIEIIKSFNFFEDLMTEEPDLYFKIIAAEGWDKDKNLLKIDSEIFNEVSQKWVSDAPFAINGKPSLQSSFLIFGDNLDIEKDLLTGFVDISYEHYSPHVAKEVVEKIITKVNNILREEDIEVAEQNIIYLKKEIGQTQLADLRNGLSELIEKQIEKISIAKSQSQYVFKTISKPYAKELKSAPKRSTICIIITFFGGIFSILYVLFTNYFFKD
tara:strand:+ start:313 stop:1242 length:930 start_codon:yes stop_codon:yes gene_type:complete